MSQLLVKEMYTTLQGEGPSMGRLAFFIRLSGCSLRCRYCDSEYAFDGGDTYHVDDILKKVKESGQPLVVITGGEPLDQKETSLLMQKLVEQGYEVELETSGHRSLQSVPHGVRVLLDIKTPGSGMSQHQNWDNLQYLNDDDVVKCVITDREDYLWVRDQIRDQLDQCGIEVWLSPASRVEAKNNYTISHQGLKREELAQWMLEDKSSHRMQLQMHRLIWGNQKTR